MKLVPPLRAIPLALAVSGELVLLKRTGGTSLTIVSKANPQSLALITLDKDPGYSSIPPDFNPIVLSYGLDYGFHAAQLDKILPANDLDINTNGIMLIGEDVVSIRLKSKQEGFRLAYYSVSEVQLWTRSILRSQTDGGFPHGKSD